MRVAFLGNDVWSVAPLRALADASDIEVALVVTNPPRPAGRGSKLTPTAVADAARALDLPLLEVGGVRSDPGFGALGALEPDALVVVAYGEILTPAVLDIPRLGSVNVHFSLLPRWRGAAPVQHAILEGDEITGVTVMLMDEGMDTGPILSTEETTIGPHDDAGSLGDRLAQLGAGLLIDTLRGFASGHVKPRRQRDRSATYAPRLRPEERTIDWASPADAIVRKVRALAPEPGAVTTFRGASLKVLKSDLIQVTYDPGTTPMQGRLATEVGTDIPGVDVVGAIVQLLEVVPAGRARMSGAEWARGARFEPGELLG